MTFNKLHVESESEAEIISWSNTCRYVTLASSKKHYITIYDTFRGENMITIKAKNCKWIFKNDKEYLRYDKPSIFRRKVYYDCEKLKHVKKI